MDGYQVPGGDNIPLYKWPKTRWGFIKKNVLSITSSGEIGFWEHDIEASKMQGRTRGRKGERKTYYILNEFHWG